MMPSFLPGNLAMMLWMGNSPTGSLGGEGIDLDGVAREMRLDELFGLGVAGASGRARADGDVVLDVLEGAGGVDGGGGRGWRRCGRSWSRAGCFRNRGGLGFVRAGRCRSGMLLGATSKSDECNYEKEKDSAGSHAPVIVTVAGSLQVRSKNANRPPRRAADAILADDFPTQRPLPKRSGRSRSWSRRAGRRRRLRGLPADASWCWPDGLRALCRSEGSCRSRRPRG